MKYTFLLPAYKATFFKEAIDSILAQTYKDFTLIISDDCSPYELQNIIEQYSDDRITYRRNEHNIGAERLVDHWNLLLSLAKSEYVILAPDDDVYHPYFLEEINKLTIKYPHVDVFKSRAQHIDSSGEILRKDMLYDECISQLDDICLHTSGNFISGIGNYVFKVSALRKIGGFVSYPMAWWSDVMTHIKLANNGMAVTRDILFGFRQSDENISSQKESPVDWKKKVYGTIQFSSDLKDLISSLNLISEYDKCRVDNWTKLLRNWRQHEIFQAAPAFTFKEIRSIIKANPDIFTSYYIKYKLCQDWLLKRI